MGPANNTRLPEGRKPHLRCKAAFYATDAITDHALDLLAVLRGTRRAHNQNTLILFLSDNGASAEWDPWGFDGRSGPDNVLHRGAELEGMGQWY